ncbi:MAG: hypothetical protein EOP04_03855 [Proteobacteria bacterium]|nr:MAG: hypothetical protein EOP04_03855 [Pseudomonadota bacterium]
MKLLICFGMMLSLIACGDDDTSSKLATIAAAQAATDSEEVVQCPSAGDNGSSMGKEKRYDPSLSCR